MKIRIGVLAFFVAVIVAGCSGSSTTTNETTPEPASSETSGALAVTVEQARKAGEISQALANEPARSAEILAEHGISAESLQNLMVEIAKDSLLTHAFEEGKRGAGSQ